MKPIFRHCAIAVLTAALSSLAVAQDYSVERGDREFTLSGTGTSDKDFDNSNFGVSGDYGWYRSSRMVWGIRQSANFADIQGASLSDDFWAGSTRGYLDYHFGNGRLRPFIGGSVGAIYGSGVNETGVAGLEAGLKYYALENTFIFARGEYQFLFDSGDSAQNNFDDGAWAYVFGIGFNF